MFVHSIRFIDIGLLLLLLIIIIIMRRARGFERRGRNLNTTPMRCDAVRRGATRCDAMRYDTIR